MKQKDLNPVLLLAFHLMVSIYSFFTFIPYYIFSWGFYGSERDHAIRKKHNPVPGKLERLLYPGLDTLPKVFEYVALRFPHRECLGTRELISEEDVLQSNGKKFSKVSLVECNCTLSKRCVILNLPVSYFKIGINIVEYCYVSLQQYLF